MFNHMEMHKHLKSIYWHKKSKRKKNLTEVYEINNTLYIFWKTDIFEVEVISSTSYPGTIHL